MTDNFDFKKYLTTNRLGAYARAGIDESIEETRAAEKERRALAELDRDDPDYGAKGMDAQELGSTMTHPDNMDDMPMDEPVEVGQRIHTTDTGESFIVKAIGQDSKGNDAYIVDAPSGRNGMGATEWIIPFSKAVLHPQQLGN